MPVLTPAIDPFDHSAMPDRETICNCYWNPIHGYLTQYLGIRFLATEGTIEILSEILRGRTAYSCLSELHASIEKNLIEYINEMVETPGTELDPYNGNTLAVILQKVWADISKRQ